ncbi:multidrug effflux MFS transporter [Dehalobacter sp. DCM]|uniref:multidrug effflux MFS transporter n=1 Tax=Dehalobacter sp. DCM TaxID=2907827 RepID=UPI003081629B|nr:multidrug effflux MFS transporter [Dehalobacter sp. DCM]
MTNEKFKKQIYLGNRGLIVLIALLSAFVPMTTDLYLPALPHMADSFQSTAGVVNMTLIFFFIFYAVGSLIFGPLSDRFGRKPLLLFGIIVYIISSILCAAASSIYLLIGYRVLQALGSGALSAVSMAIIKDVYDEKERVSILAVVQSMIFMAPIIAPVVGALILKVTTWRGIFGFLSLIGLISLIGIILFKETLEEKTEGNVFQSICRLGTVLRNPGFSSLTVTFSLGAIPLMAYVSSSSYIYIDQFGLSEQLYSFFFAANAVASVIAPFLYIKLCRRHSDQTIINSAFIITALSGFLIALFGSHSPLFFVLTLIPSTLACGLLRPPSTNIIFEQHPRDNGSVSSLLNFIMTLFGSFGMILISLDWTNRIVIIGIMYFIAAFISLLSWNHLVNKGYVHSVEAAK